MLDGHPFALGLTHDVDRPFKHPIHGIYYALTERDPSHLRSLRSGANPYWLFDDLLALEEDLGVRSSFYFLCERSLFERDPRAWFDRRYATEHLGRYALDDPRIADLIADLDRGGWEVGLHGSYDSYADPDLLRAEKADLERVLGHAVVGGRQHHLNLSVPETWEYHADVGLRYDASLGSSTEYGFGYGYTPLRPFDDEFVVFPLTVMERTLPDVETNPERAWRELDRLLAEARDNRAVMSVLWHPTYFDEQTRPGYRTLYRRLVERALEMDAWVGPLGDLYESGIATPTIETKRLDRTGVNDATDGSWRPPAD